LEFVVIVIIEVVNLYNSLLIRNDSDVSDSSYLKQFIGFSCNRVEAWYGVFHLLLANVLVALLLLRRFRAWLNSGWYVYFW